MCLYSYLAKVYIILLISYTTCYNNPSHPPIQAWGDPPIGAWEGSPIGIGEGSPLPLWEGQPLPIWEGILLRQDYLSRRAASSFRKIKRRMVKPNKEEPP